MLKVKSYCMSYVHVFIENVLLLAGLCFVQSLHCCVCDDRVPSNSQPHFLLLCLDAVWWPRIIENGKRFFICLYANENMHRISGTEVGE